VQDKVVVTTADQYKAVYDHHFQWPWTTPNPDSRSTL